MLPFFFFFKRELEISLHQNTFTAAFLILPSRTKYTLNPEAQETSNERVAVPSGVKSSCLQATVASQSTSVKVSGSNVIMKRRRRREGGKVKAALSALDDAHFIPNGSGGGGVIGRTCRSQVDGDNATPARPCALLVWKLTFARC